MIKRNCKKILLLIMTLLVGNHNIEAMGGAGAFVKTVIFSKAGIAGACAAGISFNSEVFSRIIGKALPEATVNWPAKQEIRNICKNMVMQM